MQEHSPACFYSYLYEPNDDYSPLARINHNSTSNSIEYYHSEVNGQPLELTDSEGTILWSATYNSWGKLLRLNQINDREGRVFGIDQPLRYAGQYADNETGLHYNTFRYYDPEIGRFTQQDPIGLEGGINLYQYAPNPLGWVDPWGLSCGNSQKRFNKRDRITNRYVDLLTGKKPADVESYLNSKGWKTTYPQSATPQKTQHVVFEKTTKSGEVYHLDYNPSGKTHNSDYWKVIKPNDLVETVYGRIGHGGFERYDKIKNSPVYVDGVLMNPWRQ